MTYSTGITPMHCITSFRTSTRLLTRLVCCLQYEPELFPGLIYRMVDPKVVLLIFVSGKVVLTGAKVS